MPRPDYTAGNREVPSPDGGRATNTTVGIVKNSDPQWQPAGPLSHGECEDLDID